MKLSITKLTTAVAVAALLALPVSAAQTPPSQPPATAQPPASSGSQQPATTPQNAADQTPSITEARQHLAKAKAALDEVNVSTLDARVKSQITDMNRRVSALERSVAENAAENASAKWGTEIGEIDKLLTNLVGEEATTGVTSPTPTGTSGKAAAVELDDATRSKLLEVRTHLTAFATAMVGGQVRTPTPSTDPTTDPNATPPPSTPTPTTPQPTGTSGTTPQQPTGTTGQTQPPAQAGQPDEQAARQHLTTARNTLSEITQLPAAAQLTGETRNHVSQLISNFNELISAKSEWRGSYAKVSANLTALLGPDVGTPDPSGAPGTAVGTSGTPAASLDPEIREKLMQFRRQLAEFEKAVGGTAASVQSPSAADTAPAATPPEVTRPTDPTAPPATTPPATTPPATPPPATTPPSGTEPTMPTTQGTAGAQAAGNAEIMRHIAAIEAMFKAEDDSGGVTLTKLQLEQLRAHLANLRQAIEKR